MAVLGTNMFDVTLIDPSSIKLSFGGTGNGVPPIRWALEDVATPFEGELCGCNDLNGDGYMDLTLKFDTQELVNTLSLSSHRGETIRLSFSGNLKEGYGGTPIFGQDCAWIPK